MLESLLNLTTEFQGQGTFMLIVLAWVSMWTTGVDHEHVEHNVEDDERRDGTLQDFVGWWSCGRMDPAIRQCKIGCVRIKIALCNGYRAFEEPLPLDGYMRKGALAIVMGNPFAFDKALPPITWESGI
ncbi:hypothetical protein EV424DRAFT_1553665 [Suillus variegatus]|nr:hypothetical protein EV424DRAFT_1553665 [Suillus variegatus]